MRGSGALSGLVRATAEVIPGHDGPTPVGEVSIKRTRKFVNPANADFATGHGRIAETDTGPPDGPFAMTALLELRISQR